MGFWIWLGELKPAQAAIVAALLGFLTLSAGHLLNSWLSRRRDQFILDMERLNLLRSITIEISQLSQLARLQLHQIESFSGNQIEYSIMNPLSLAVVYQNNLSNIHKLPPESLLQIVPFYVGLLEHVYNLEAHGAKSVGESPSIRTFNLRVEHVARFRQLNTDLDKLCHLALSVCYPIVQELERKLEGRASARPIIAAFKPCVADDV